MNRTLTGVAVAASCAALFASAVAQAGDTPDSSKSKDPSVKCGSINSCKGKGSCAGAANSCAGMNACKGKGWVPKKTAAECTAAGGTVVPTQAAK